MSRRATLVQRCASCTHNATRSFSTSPAVRRIGPESPRYIDIPEPPQKTFDPRPRIKGVLPVPRDIFSKRRGGVEKVTPEYLDNTTQVGEPRTRPSHDREAALNDWKLRMAERRRQNLREGLTELQTRRVKFDTSMTRKTAQRQAERQQLIEAAEREDERLTNPTTTALIKSAQTVNGRLPDPNREKRLAEMRARVEAKEAQKASDRQDALHTLYMHARNFIVSEPQLDKAIDKAFGTATEPVVWRNRGSSIWSEAVPQSIQDKLNAANRSRGTVMDNDWIANTTLKRVGKIAEQLTGGKMEKAKN